MGFEGARWRGGGGLTPKYERLHPAGQTYGAGCAGSLTEKRHQSGGGCLHQLRELDISIENPTRRCKITIKQCVHGPDGSFMTDD